MALSRVISEIFNVENVVTLKSRSEVTQVHSLKALPFDRLDMVSYYCAKITL